MSEKQDTSPSAPLTMKNVVVKEKDESNQKIKMMLLTFLSFIFITVMPLITFSDYGNISIYATDITRISSTVIDLVDVKEGNLVDNLEHELEKNTKKIEIRFVRKLAENLADTIVDFAKNVKSTIFTILFMIKFIFMIIMTLIAMFIAGFAVMIIAAVKNKKKLFLIINGITLFLLTAITAATIWATSSDASFIGTGLWLSMLMMVLSFYIPFRKTENVKAYLKQKFHQLTARIKSCFKKGKNNGQSKA